MFKTKIRKTIKLLDKKIPDWRNKISLQTLDLRDGCNCVGGQISESGWLETVEIITKLKRPEITDSDDFFFERYRKITRAAQGLAFILSGDEDTKENWKILQREWLEILKEEGFE